MTVETLKTKTLLHPTANRIDSKCKVLPAQV